MKKGPGSNRNGLIAALDVGSSKVCCFIAQTGSGGQSAAPRVLGIGQQASRGIKNGAIVDMEAAEVAIRNAVHAAEQMAGDTIERVVLGLSSGKPLSRQIAVEVALDGSHVGDRDLRRALSLGHEPSYLNGHIGEGRELVHSIPLAYSVDGSRGIRDPRGMVGERLGVDLHLVTAGSGPVRNLVNCVERCHLEVGGFVVAPYASGLSVLVEDERDLGVTLIDMGGGTTSIAVFFEGKVIHTDVLPVGGLHVTTDIARGLSTPVAHAERIKTLYGHAIAASADDRELIDVPQVGEYDEGSVHQVPRSLLNGIIQPRLEETFELVRSRLEQSGMYRLGGRRVVLTGGACQLPGVNDMAALILDRKIRIGRPSGIVGLAEATAGPAHAVTAGLVLYAIEAERILEVMPRVQAQAAAVQDGGMTQQADLPFLGRVGGWLREHF
ncbi:cell division protein FtsA [Limibacillus sp. MBR-115]|jgi:cell division protein FtsA|uniref:cell division protein FtsA n=1 Tax=Limibacillus sp. MBR-115 TaxID=3156465 RepID=UPI00339B24DA